MSADVFVAEHSGVGRSIHISCDELTEAFKTATWHYRRGTRNRRGQNQEASGGEPGGPSTACLTGSEKSPRTLTSKRRSPLMSISRFDREARPSSIENRRSTPAKPRSAARVANRPNADSTLPDSSAPDNAMTSPACTKREHSRAYQSPGPTTRRRHAGSSRGTSKHATGHPGEGSAGADHTSTT